MLKVDYTQMHNWLENTIEDGFCRRYTERYIIYNENGEFEFHEGKPEEGKRVVFESEDNLFAINDYEVDEEGYVYTNAEIKGENYKVTESTFISEGVATTFNFSITVPLEHEVEKMKEQGLPKPYIDEYKINAKDLDRLLHMMILGISQQHDNKKKLKIK